MLKSLINRVPVLRSLATRVLGAWSRLTFRGSADYWERRYRRGGQSGSGSYDRLAEFKAEVLNGYVAEHGVKSVVELGCGDGHQLSLAKYPRYVGLDVSQTAVENCRRRFAGDSTKEFHEYRPEEGVRVRAELALSLDVLYHLVEDEVFAAHLRDLFAAGERFVVIYSSNVDDRQSLAHVRRRKFTEYVAAHFPAWRLREHIANPYPLDPARPHETSDADFFFYEPTDPQV